nr:hypothetical protein [Nocardia carnea]
MFHRERTPAGLLFDLTGRRGGNIFGVIDVPSRQLPHPLVDDPPVPVHQQYLAVVVEYQCHRTPRHPGNVLGELRPVRETNIGRRQPDVPILVDQSLTEDRPLGIAHLTDGSGTGPAADAYGHRHKKCRSSAVGSTRL